MSRRRTWLAVFALVAALLGYVLIDAPAGPRSLRHFDPDRTAALELDMWQAYALIAVENALLYEVPVEKVLAASILRARAGRLRDQGGDRADWAQVSRLLQQSFRELHAAVQK